MVCRQSLGNIVRKFRGFLYRRELLDHQNDFYSQKGLFWALVVARVRAGAQCLNITKEVDTHRGPRFLENLSVATEINLQQQYSHCYYGPSHRAIFISAAMYSARWRGQRVRGFLYTNYMPIYNHPCDTENEFTAWIPVIIAILLFLFFTAFSLIVEFLCDYI